MSNIKSYLTPTHNNITDVGASYGYAIYMELQDTRIVYGFYPVKNVMFDNENDEVTVTLKDSEVRKLIDGIANLATSGIPYCGFKYVEQEALIGL